MALPRPAVTVTIGSAISGDGACATAHVGAASVAASMTVETSGCRKREPMRGLAMLTSPRVRDASIGYARSGAGFPQAQAGSQDRQPLAVRYPRHAGAVLVDPVLQVLHLLGPRLGFGQELRCG